MKFFSHIRRLVVLSRPVFWIYTGGLFLLGAITGAAHAGANIPWTSASFLSVWAWFIIGENMFGVYINDYYDREIDRSNPRKKNYWDHTLRFALWGLVILSAAGFGFLAVRVGGIMLWTYGFAFFLCTFLYNVPPARCKERPPFDLLIGASCALPPLFAGYSFLTGEWPPLWAIAAGMLVWIAFDFLDKLFDADADRAAGVRTSATVLGLSTPRFKYRYAEWLFVIGGTLFSIYAWYLYLR